MSKLIGSDKSLDEPTTARQLIEDLTDEYTTHLEVGLLGSENIQSQYFLDIGTHFN